jgi:hypothetical protein
MALNVSLQPIPAIIAGILILIKPSMLNHVIAIFLILFGILGLVQYKPRSQQRHRTLQPARPECRKNRKPPLPAAARSDPDSVFGYGCIRDRDHFAPPISVNGKSPKAAVRPPLRPARDGTVGGCFNCRVEDIVDPIPTTFAFSVTSRE